MNTLSEYCPSFIGRKWSCVEYDRFENIWTWYRYVGDPSREYDPDWFGSEQQNDT